MPVEGLCQPAVANLAGRNAKRPAHHQHAHRRRDLFAGEPVSNHLREEHGAEHKPGPANQPANCRQRETVPSSHQCAANRQAGQTEANQCAVAGEAPDVSCGQRKHQARQHEKTDKGPDFCKADGKFQGDMIRNGTDRLELNAETGSRHKQYRQNNPPVHGNSCAHYATR